MAIITRRVAFDTVYSAPTASARISFPFAGWFSTDLDLELAT